MLAGIKDKVVVVTGGAGLLGKEFCQAIATNGAIAIMADRELSVAEKAVEALGMERVIPAQIDITDTNSIQKLITSISEKFGKIDALINSAYPRNKNYGKHFFEVTYDDFSVSVVLNYYRRDSKRTLEILTDEGTYLVDLLRNNISYNDEIVFQSSQLSLETYTAQMQFFVEEILNKQTKFNTIVEGYKVLELCLQE